MNQNRNPAELQTFLRDDNEDGRMRLHFCEVRKRRVEIAFSVQLIRDRVIDLQKNFKGDAAWALMWFHIATAGTLVIAAFAVLIGMYPIEEPAELTAAAFGILAALIGALAQALGWHKQYGAMFAASWEMSALRIRIDQEIIGFLIRSDDITQMNDELQSSLTESTEAWVVSVERILATFGDKYGYSIATPTVPSLKL